MQDRPVPLQRHEIVAAPRDDFLRDVALRSHGVDGDEGAGEFEPSSSRGMAMISLDFWSAASWPSTRRWRAAQAETTCNGPRPLARAWLRREVLPSMAIMSGSVSRNSSTQSAKSVLKNWPSSALMTSLMCHGLEARVQKGESGEENQAVALPRA